MTQSANETPALWRNALNSRSAAADETISKVAASCFHSAMEEGLSLVAVGGYGRQELFPYSDVDLLLLADSNARLAEAAEPFSNCLRLLWDLGFRVSQSAHTAVECCQLNEQNIELHISLLDARFLTGDARVFDNLSTSLVAFYARQRHTLTRKLAAMTRGRHTKFNNTTFHLEPNIKETPGGIRDIHFLHWLSRLAPSNEALEDAKRQSDSARDFLYPLRGFLHDRARRDHNLLTFDLQDSAARELGGGMEPEEWMRRYFFYARQTWQAVQRALEFTDSLDKSLIQALRDRRARLSTTNYTIVQERVLLRNPRQTTQDAESIFELFIFSARHGIRLSWDAQRRIRSESATIAAHFQSQPAIWPLWRELLSQPHASLALHEMQETGVLTAAIPEWRAVDSLVVRDFYHRYTVDEHTLVAIGIVDELSQPGGEGAARMKTLLSEAGDTALLRFALLLHDIGKGVIPGEHVEGSLTTATAIMERLRVPPEHQRTILFLIEHHLDLSLIMNGRDLDDPATARFLAQQTLTVENLRYLTLLTYADISAVNPTAMTPWRLEQLWRVYSIGHNQLTRELETSRIHTMDNLPEADHTPAMAEFLEGLPTRYLRTHSVEEIRHHCELHRRIDVKGVAVEILDRKDSFQAIVLAFDKSGLFASLCGALASFGMNIVKAEAFNNASGLVVDEFRFTDPLRTLELNPTEIDRLRKTIERVVLGIDDVRFLLQRRRLHPRPPRVARIAPSVRFNNEASDSATLVDFVAEDRPGLLYDLASTFAKAECNIEIVLIDTEAHKAVDVFYVTRDGAKLNEAMQDDLRVSLLRVAEG
ncbi:MAG TPA: HD domain-containing protein [Bryobacteraceae bacterium]|nr:HD domain-containing protein [Bryobacteraceae bacterium]